MELQQLKSTDFPLLSRKRVEYMMSFKGATPARIDVVEALAKAEKSKSDTVAIRHIYTKFGVEKAKIIAHVYKSNEEMKQFENEKLIAKQLPKPVEAEE